jgi:hypothetical protein
MYSLVVLKKFFFIGNNSFLPFLSASMLLYHNVIVNITERKLEGRCKITKSSWNNQIYRKKSDAPNTAIMAPTTS